jgi:hypothetical protein
MDVGGSSYGLYPAYKIWMNTEGSHIPIGFINNCNRNIGKSYQYQD